jgi:REP-associated tyrosine transposase
MSRPHRIVGHEYVGEQEYFLTICTYQRSEAFTQDAVARMVIDQFLQTAREHEMDIIAYCVMPDHLHALVAGRHEGAALEPFVKLAKQRAGFEFKQHHRQKLWQRGYYEHVLRSDERTEDVVRYIIENPLRKGLVENILDYPYWGSSLCDRAELLSGFMTSRTAQRY